MATITVRNVPDSVHRALKHRAATNGRSAEAEIRDILEKATLPDGRLKLGTYLFNVARSAGVEDSDVEAINQARDRSTSDPVKFE